MFEEPQPQTPQAGKLPVGKILDPGILEDFDHQALCRAQILANHRFTGVNEVRGRVRRRRAVDIDTLDAIVAVEGIRQVHQVVFDVRPAAPPGFEIVRGRAHEKRARPQRPQVKIQLAMIIDEQRTAALALQHRLRGFGSDTEVSGLPFEIALISLRSPGGPAAQAAQRQFGQQFAQRLHHRTQAARRLAGELMQQFEITAQQVGIAEPGCRQWQISENQRDHRTRGQRRQFHDGLDRIRHDVFADFLRHHRHFLHVGQHQVLALAQRAHGLDADQVILEPLRRHDALRLEPGGLDRIEVTEVLGIDAFQVFGKLGVHGYVSSSPRKRGS